MQVEVMDEVGEDTMQEAQDLWDQFETAKQNKQKKKEKIQNKIIIRSCTCKRQNLILVIIA